MKKSGIFISLIFVVLITIIYAKIPMKCKVTATCAGGIECSCEGNSCQTTVNGVKCYSNDGTSAECTCS